MPWRIAASLLLATSALSLPCLLGALLFLSDPALTPPVLMRLFVILSVLPAVAGHLATSAAAAEISVGISGLVLRRRDVTIEVPGRAIAHVSPWLLPLPLPGFSVQLRSGQWMRYGIAVEDPAAVLEELARDCDCEAAAAAARHPMALWAHERAAYGRAGAVHHFFKFVVFALAPTAILFNAHQHISYGGLLGQYHLESAQAWLQSLAVYWATISIYLVLYAGTLRGVAEGIGLAWIAARPASARSLREWIERILHLLYYGGVPAMVGLRFVDW